MGDKVPDYDAYQDAFHLAFNNELYSIVDALPVPEDGSVIDVPCGGGFYTRRFAERIGPKANLTAVDSNDEYLAKTDDETERTAVDVQVVKADAYNLPFADATFDLVWCAESLISLDPDRALREMLRIVKQDGVVAILEVDEFHHILLQWPVELEAALPLALEAASLRRYGDKTKLSPARRLRHILKEAGFASVRRRTHAFDRTAPFDPSTDDFLNQHFAFLRSFVYEHLPKPMQRAFDHFTDPETEGSLLRTSEAELVCLQSVHLARRSS
jgi:ubiquinone/menaquinone biosynthesis C-methylase UbiE